MNEDDSAYKNQYFEHDSIYQSEYSEVIRKDQGLRG